MTSRRSTAIAVKRVDHVLVGVCISALTSKHRVTVICTQPVKSQQGTINFGCSVRSPLRIESFDRKFMNRLLAFGPTCRLEFGLHHHQGQSDVSVDLLRFHFHTLPLLQQIGVTQPVPYFNGIVIQAPVGSKHKTSWRSLN